MTKVEEKDGLVTYTTKDEKFVNSLVKNKTGLLAGFIFHRKVGDTFYLKFQKKYEQYLT